MPGGKDLREAVPGLGEVVSLLGMMMRREVKRRKSCGVMEEDMIAWVVVTMSAV